MIHAVTNERGGQSMMEFDQIEIAIVAEAMPSMKIVELLSSCGVSQEHITLVRPDAWPELIRNRFALCVWRVANRYGEPSFLPDLKRTPEFLGNCLNVRIEDEPHIGASPYVLRWDELDSSDLRVKMRQLIEEARIRQNFRMHEQWYRLAVAEANVGLWWWDRHLNFIYLSEHFQQMLGLTHEQLPANVEQWLEFVHPEDRDTLYGTIDIHFDEDAGRFQVECRLKHADGVYHWYNLSGQLRSDDRSRSMILGSAVDITQRKEVEIELAQAHKQAQAAIIAKNEFLTNMSHNIRTPLNAILGHADLIRDLTSSSDTNDSVDAICRNSQELMKLLDDILELSCIETVHPAAKLEKTSIQELVQCGVEVFRPKATEHGLKLAVNLYPDTPDYLFVDFTRTRQILSRLIDNAIKFTQEGEVGVDISFHRYPTPTLELIIRDTGAGIPAARLESIFEPFSQADNSPSRSHAGSGLGLSISRRLVHILGGSLDIESEVGNGTSVLVRIPVEVPSESILPVRQPTSESKTPELPSLDGYRVLLVEDGRDNQVVISTFLRKGGAEVTLAENGQEAVDWVRSHRQEAIAAGLEADSSVDLVLMDMQMPVLDGYAATRLLRQEEFTKPVIALTAHALKGDRERCLEAGCDDYFTKPIKRAALLEIVKRFGELSRQATTSTCQ
ncbi:hypothetical protein GCM10023155_19150 [Bremerella cremea]